MTDAGQTMRPSNWQLLVHQVRYQNRVFWRSPMAAFFTLVFPLMFLLVFVSVFGNGMISALGVPMAQFYAPSLGVYGAITAAYTNLAIMTVTRRDEGILKRVRGTPLPPLAVYRRPPGLDNLDRFHRGGPANGCGNRIFRHPSRPRHFGRRAPCIPGGRWVFRRSRNDAGCAGLGFKLGGGRRQRDIAALGIRVGNFHPAVFEFARLGGHRRRHFSGQALCPGVFGGVQPHPVWQWLPVERRTRRVRHPFPSCRDGGLGSRGGSARGTLL